MAVGVGARAFEPRLPDLKDLRMDRLRCVYERAIDTMFVDFYGRPRPASSEPLDTGDRDYIFVRIDPKPEEVVGLQIEDFLSYAVVRNPVFLELLGIAELRGVGEPEASELRHRGLMQSRAAEDPTFFMAALQRVGA